ncbi:MAG: LytTR family DNA-binding domain-containing protein [Pedobacter sp.]
MKCVIIDDEPFAHQVLEHYISQTPGLELKAKFRNTVEAFEYLGKSKIDLLFLDIEMPLINGIHFLSMLPNPPQTIFTTAHKQYAFEGFELSALDYLLKPFSFERFTKAINKASIGSGEKSDMAVHNLVIKDKEGMLNLNQQHILYIEGCRDYVKIITDNQTHIIYHTLKGILEKLNSRDFIQAHRSYLVNRIHVNRIHQDGLMMHDKTVIPIGQHYRKQLLEQING